MPARLFSVNGAEDLEYGVVPQNSNTVVVAEPLVKIRTSFPYYTVFIFTFNWLVYLYGIVFLIGWNNAHFSLTSPLSPPDQAWWFLTVRFYPSCDDIRYQYWRPLSEQFVHAGLGHIGGNTIAGVGFGFLFESFQPYGFLITGVIYQLAVIFGSLGHSAFIPFNGLVGCSPGVYGVIGACWTQVLFNRQAMPQHVALVLAGCLAIQMLVDILLYYLYWQSDAGYVSHAFGLFTGFTLGCVYTVWIQERKTRLKALLALVMGCGFVLMAVWLLYHYLAVWPPHPYRAKYFVHNVSQSSQGCCAQLYLYAEDNQMSLDEARSATYCDYETIYPNRVHDDD